MKKFFKIIGVIIGVFIVIGIIGAIAGGNSSSSTQSSAPQPATTQTTTTKPTAPAPKPAPAAPSKDDELANMLKAAPAPTVSDDGFMKTVTYTLTNNTQDTFDYVEIDYDIFNKDGIKTNSDMTNITNVTPGQKFQLKLTLSSSDGESNWKVTGIYSDALHQ